MSYLAAIACMPRITQPDSQVHAEKEQQLRQQASAMDVVDNKTWDIRSVQISTPDPENMKL